MRKKKEQPRHPDPVIEQKLENIRQIHRMLDECEKLISSHSDAAKSANDNDGLTTEKVAYGDLDLVTMNSVMEANCRRRTEAANRITALYEHMTVLQDRAVALIAAINDNDLAYL